MTSHGTDRTTSRGSSSLRSLGLAVLLAAASASSLQAAAITKSGTGTDLTAGASWTGSAAPGSADVATWTSTSLGAGLTLATAKTWQGVDIQGALTDIQVTGVGLLTLSGAASSFSIGAS